mgnify:CR=1 FL=1
MAPAQLGKRRRDKRGLSVPAGRGLAACAKRRKGSSDVIGTVPKAPKDPLPLMAPAQLGKRRRDKRAYRYPQVDGSQAMPKAEKDPFPLMAHDTRRPFGEVLLARARHFRIPQRMTKAARASRREFHTKGPIFAKCRNLGPSCEIETLARRTARPEPRLARRTARPEPRLT